jgi:threonine aldolase
MLGGGMRQAGVLAAAGLIALNEMVERLAQDHANARRLASGLAAVPGIEIEPVETNLIFGNCLPPLTAAEFVQRCREVGVLLDQVSQSRWRMVTHRGVLAEDVEYAVDAVKGAFAPAPARTVGAAS